VFLGLPLAVLVERSLAVGGGYGLDAYRALGRPTSVLLVAPWEAIVNSVVYAVAATAIAVVVGGLAAYAIAERRSRLLDGLVLLPLGASAVMLGLGLLIAFDTAPLDFRASAWIVPVAQALVALPFVVRIMAPTLRSIDPHQREAAALLGASPSRVRLEIDLPIISRGLAVAAGFAFAISLGEFGATVFLARADAPTLPVAVFRCLGRPGADNVGTAAALSAVLVLLPLGASAVMLGLGFLIAFDTAPLDFRAAPWLVPVAQALIAIPFVVRILVPTLRSIDPRQREAAALLGAAPGRVRREIDLPIVSRGLAVAAGFAFAISLGEFGATVFLARPDRPTLPVAIFRFLGRPGELNLAQAYALAVVLMGVTVVAVLLVERVRPRRGGWF
jgi:ABC-type Fe3+ transport system permease subunit